MKTFLIILYVLNIITYILNIGEPREPISKELATMMTVAQLLIIYGIIKFL